MPIPSLRLSHWLVLTTLLSSALPWAHAHADAVSDARSHYDRALKFYDDGVYDAALVELTRAYELNPSYRIVYNIAQARVAMRDYAGAIESYQRYLREGGSQVSNERVAAVRGQLSELQQRVGSLTIDSDVSGSEVLIDDVVVGTTPLPTHVLVNAGMRRVSLRHPDYPQRTERVSIAGGEQLKATLLLRPQKPELQTQANTTLAPEAPQLSATASEPTPEPRSTSLSLSAADTTTAQPNRTAAWVMTGVTGALAASAIVFAVVAQNQNSDLATRRSNPDENPAQFDADRDVMKRTALLTDVFTVAAIASAGVTTWLWLRTGDESAVGAARSHGLRLGLAGASAQLRGEF
jgi:hypothetical protein